MKVNFGCIVLKDDRILLVREKSEKHKQLEKWNLISGKLEKGEFIFDGAIMRENQEETGVRAKVRGVVAVYESVVKGKQSLYFVVGCDALKEKIRITDGDIIDVKWFDLKDFWEMSDEEIVHEDMKLVTKKYMDGKYINLVKHVRYDD
jgi:ADP-ribose pyrophosphatase YjhB (NUDIX family)